MNDIQYLTALLEPLLEEPAKLRIIRTVDDMGVLLCVTGSRNDTGLIIGRAGATVNAIRTLMHIFGRRNNARINVKLLEPEGEPYVKNQSLEETLKSITNSKTISS